MMESDMKRKLILIALAGLLAWSGPGSAQLLDEAGEMALAELIVGPEGTDDECAGCHTLEHEAWQTTRHYATFKDRHRSDEAKEILAKLGERSMKRISTCRQCHYTSSISDAGKIRASWGVSCESCHGPAANWLEVHNRPGGDPAADTMEWGDGQLEAPESRQARLDASAAKGMLHPANLYDIASNCYGCHTVPDENLVNVGKHHAGKPFDLVERSQGEVRHNFVSSTGSPANRPASAEQKRRLYVVGAAVDLEFGLRNLARVGETGGDFHQATIERINAGRAKLAAITGAADLPALAAVVQAIPASLDASNSVDASLADQLRDAAQAFVADHDGTQLAALDALVPTDVSGEAYEP